MMGAATTPMPLATTLRAADALLLVIDVQERLLPAIADGEAVAAQTARLLQAAQALEVPRWVTEQYVRGLGPTVATLQPWLAGAERCEKLHFSALRAAGFGERLRASGRRQVVLCGVEAHVCVLQTGLDVLAAGLELFVVTEACGSRRVEDRALGLARLQQAGARLVNVEMVVFEWLEQAGTPQFKALLPLIK